MHQISRAMFRLQSELKADWSIERLAKEARMSRSEFFRGFKAMTGLSPVQYQKRLRLLEARRRLHETPHCTAEGAAFAVGYRSASQFSREYARMFGRPGFG